MFLKLESDDELRARIMYVGGDGEMRKHEIRNATGLKLDEIAWRLSLRRRAITP